MSGDAIKKILTVELRAPMKPVLLALAWFHHPKHGCFPSIKTLALATGLSDRTVQRAMRDLAAMGYVAYMGASKYRTNRWQLRATGNGSPRPPPVRKKKKTHLRLVDNVAKMTPRG